MQLLSGGQPRFRLIRLFSFTFLAVGAIFIVFFWRLGNLTPGLSPAEDDARSTNLTIQSILDHPINAPQRLLQYGLQAAAHPGAFWTRLGSVFFGLSLIACFYWLAKAWFGPLIATLATLLLATTPWLILLSRSSTADILLLAPVALMASYIYLSRVEGTAQSLGWLWLITAVGFGLYVPGVIWLIVIGALVKFRQLARLIYSLPALVISAGAILLLLIMLPLVLAISRDWTIIKPLLLIPTDWPAMITALKSTGWAVLALVWRTPEHVDQIIGRLPVLDVVQVVLGFFGLTAMWQRARQEMVLLMALLIFSVLAAGLNQNIKLLTLGLPAVGLIVAAGLRYLYIEWRSVFPRNPLPRALALVLMWAVVGLHVWLGIRYSLIAWPHTVDTRQTYVIK